MVVYGHRIPFSELLTNPGFYSSLASSTLCTALVMFIVSRFTRDLDSRLPWHHAFWRRCFMQLLAAVLIPALVALGWNLGYFAYRQVPNRIFAYAKQDLPFVIVLLLLLNAFYMRYYYWITPKTQPTETRMADAPAASAPVAADAIDTDRPLTDDTAADVTPTDGSTPEHEPACYYSEGKLTMVYWDGGNRTIDTRTIRELEKQLRGPRYFGIRKGALVRRDAIADAKPDGRRYLVTLRPPYEHMKIHVSKSRTSAFIEWYNNAST